MAKKQFSAEVGKILHLMIHSLYTNKEIFLRELISNASDACDKLRYKATLDGEIMGSDTELKINISADSDKGQIIIQDSGIGMSAGEMEENLGTIAKSGTQGFLESISADQKKNNQLIGQFGVGFYSSFLVADKVTVYSKAAAEDQVWCWHSGGQGEYEIEKSDQDMPRGTKIVLDIREDDKEFLDNFRLRHIVKSYSDSIAFPIFFKNEEGKEEQVNSSTALWMRPKSEITQDQYKEFYKNVAHAPDDPWMVIHNKNEGTTEFTNLLFVPTNKTYDLFHPDRKKRVKLYIKRVFITDENADLIPAHLRFLRGMVDCEDLPLNISRENLQHNKTMAKIKTAITNKVLGELQKIKEKDRNSYEGFWENFGAALKEGLCDAMADHQKLLELCIFKSAKTGKMISLDQYVKDIPGEQKTIYFLSGDTHERLASSPQIEGFLSRGIDVLLLTDHVDDFWVNIANKYGDYEIKSVTRSDIDLDQDADKKDEKPKAGQEELTKYFKDVLGDLVKEVKISKKLTSSPACLASGDTGMDIRMERFLKEQNQLASVSAKNLEINPDNKIIQKIGSDLSQDNQENRMLVRMIFDQACIIEGEPVAEPGVFASNVNALIERLI